MCFAEGFEVLGGHIPGKKALDIVRDVSLLFGAGRKVSSQP
jgi:hypothetical protein